MLKVVKTLHLSFDKGDRFTFDKGERFTFEFRLIARMCNGPLVIVIQIKFCWFNLITVHSIQ